jgi:hypothetical protein
MLKVGVYLEPTKRIITNESPCQSLTEPNRVFSDKPFLLDVPAGGAFASGVMSSGNHADHILAAHERATISKGCGTGTPGIAALLKEREVPQGATDRHGCGGTGILKQEIKSLAIVSLVNIIRTYPNGKSAFLPCLRVSHSQTHSMAMKRTFSWIKAPYEVIRRWIRLSRKVPVA